MYYSNNIKSYQILIYNPKTFKAFCPVIIQLTGIYIMHSDHSQPPPLFEMKFFSRTNKFAAGNRNYSSEKFFPLTPNYYFFSQLTISPPPYHSILHNIHISLSNFLSFSFPSNLNYLCFPKRPFFP